MQLTSHHATVFLDPPNSAIEDLRRTWDPEMQRQIAAHITLVYPNEIADPAELVERVACAAGRIAPFAVAVGPPFYEGSPAEGVFFSVSDPHDGLGRFRAVAVPEGEAVSFQPHVTIVHPRTSRRGEQAWAELAEIHVDVAFTVADIAITAYDGDRWVTLQAIPLTGSAV